jgi:hypothetical protein
MSDLIVRPQCGDIFDLPPIAATANRGYPVRLYNSPGSLEPQGWRQGQGDVELVLSKTVRFGAGDPWVRMVVDTEDVVRQIARLGDGAMYELNVSDADRQDEWACFSAIRLSDGRLVFLCERRELRTNDLGITRQLTRLARPEAIRQAVRQGHRPVDPETLRSGKPDFSR